MMKFSVSKLSPEGGRLGVLSDIHQSTKQRDVEVLTPACLMYTRGGSVPHLTLDMVRCLPHQSGIVELTVSSFIEYRETMDGFKDGLAKFVGISNALTYLAVQDSCKSAPAGYNDKSTVSVWAPSGRFRLNSASFMSFQRAAKSNITEALCDGDTREGCSKKRIQKAVNKTLQFLDEILEENLNAETCQQTEIFGVIEGGDLLSERLRSTKETAKRPVAGFVLDSFGESFMKEETRWKLLEPIIKELPEDKPRMLPQIGEPLDVLLAIENGIDLFSAFYPYQITGTGCALVFSWSDENKKTLNYQTNRPDDINEGFYIDLNNKKFAEDFSPVLSDCECYCCQHHTKAYINHLLVTKELMAGVLLMSHNVHHYLSYFEAIRQAIKSDTFALMKKHIQEQHMRTDR
ncbi:putative queuine tRNA-ribosyltransferase subunit QTRTD1-like [Apostichopus japonicus]|uniref:Queuine tRNA-ribosyltransferase accessory subunit 2 n=1 Tax=Stichopus japonicus TaxID=307972 RepID=A0A2G8L9E3_STIJA|nr:putative queuine tRNA-ribosyltransferase subunit QTRTD1-like [Apostichopus japonicus]